MTTEPIVAHMRQLEIFRGLSEQQLSAVAGTGERILFRPGQTIIAEGVDGDGAYLVLSPGARAAVPEGSGASEQVAPGTLLGETAMLIEHNYRVAVKAEAPLRTVKLPREALHRLMLDDPSLAQHFVSRLSARLFRVGLELRRIDQMLALASEAHPAH